VLGYKKGKAGRSRRGAHLPVKAVEPVGGWTTESVTHGQCDARPTVTFPAAERHSPLAGTKLYCLVAEAHWSEQLAQSCYLVADRPRVELAASRSRANALTTEPPSHPVRLLSHLDHLIHHTTGRTHLGCVHTDTSASPSTHIRVPRYTSVRVFQPVHENPDSYSYSCLCEHSLSNCTSLTRIAWDTKAV